jgi:hypothetical protein
MSDLRVGTISDAAGTGPVTLTGQYAAKAWVNFNGTGTVAIRESGNVTSITDNGTGNYTVNFTTALTDANYSLTVTGTYGSANGFNGTAPTATAAVVQTYVTTDGSNQDSAHVAVTVTR